jgi:hypothetical protein
VATSTSSIDPTISCKLAQLRSSQPIITQAEKLVYSLYTNTGQCIGGWGNNAPLVPDPRPQDFILRHRAMRTLFYEDLGINQCVQGFLVIVLMLENSDVIRSMTAHMQSLFTEASFLSWDPAKFTHCCMVTYLEDGIYS